MDFFSISLPELFAQLTIGLVNGAFYALLSLGLALIFGLLNIINFAHGAQYMLGAFVTLLLLRWFGFGYWVSLVVTPVVVGLFGVFLERFVIRRLYKLDHIYGLLLTLGVALVIEGTFINFFGVSGHRYPTPEALTGGFRLGYMYLPIYRIWVVVVAIVVCAIVRLAIEKTRIGAYLRASVENPSLVQAFGINVPLLIMVTYGAGVALASFAGVMAAPLYPASPLMGSHIIILVFAIVVIGGMGSLAGAVVAGFGLGVIEGLTKAFYPEAASVVIFFVMALVILFRPAGIFGSHQQEEEASW